MQRGTGEGNLESLIQRLMAYYEKHDPKKAVKERFQPIPAVGYACFTEPHCGRVAAIAQEYCWKEAVLNTQLTELYGEALQGVLDTNACANLAGVPQPTTLTATLGCMAPVMC